VGVKRVNIDGTDAMPGGAYKPLTYRQFMRILRRMQDEADVALQAQMALRGFVEPSRAVATRVLMEDGQIVSLEEAERRKVDSVEVCRTTAGGPGGNGDAAEQAPQGGDVERDSGDSGKQEVDDGGQATPKLESAEAEQEEGLEDEDGGGVEGGAQSTASGEQTPEEGDGAGEDAEEEAGEGRGLAPRSWGASVWEGSAVRLVHEGGNFAGTDMRDMEGCAQASPAADKAEREGCADEGSLPGGEACPGSSEERGGREESRRGEEERGGEEGAEEEGGGEEMSGVAGAEGASEPVQTDGGPVEAHRSGGDGASTESAEARVRQEEVGGAAAVGAGCGKPGEPAPAASGSKEPAPEPARAVGRRREGRGAAGGRGSGRGGKGAGVARPRPSPMTERPLAMTETRVVKMQLPEHECMICLEKTAAGISLPCLHGPFCEPCIRAWTAHNRSCPICRHATGVDDGDCWVHLEEPCLKDIVNSLYKLIRDA